MLIRIAGIAAAVLLLFVIVRKITGRHSAPIENESASAQSTYSRTAASSSDAGSTLTPAQESSAGGTFAVPAGTAEALAGSGSGSTEAAPESGAPESNTPASTEPGSAVPDAGAAAGRELSPAGAGSTGSVSMTELEKGRKYLSTLEERTPMEMEVLIDEARAVYEKKREQEVYAVKREEYREMLGGEAVWSSLRNYVFLGDSRVMGFTVYNFLPEERILAQAGDTINGITENLDAVRALSPDYIFVSYGINDIGIGFWPTAEEYAEAFGDRLDSLQQAVPDAQIYVNSILPASKDAVAMYPIWGGLPEYSEAVRRMCQDKGISFIDNASIVEEHEDLYEGDGVHLQPEFYRYWAENQLLGIYDRKHGKLTFPEPEEEPEPVTDPGTE